MSDRLPANLAKALPKGRVAAPVIAPVPVPAGALVDAKGVPYCHSCGTDLVDGRCPRHYPRWAAGFGTAA